MAMVDGKLYDTSFVYRSCGATFEKLCPLYIPKPIFPKSPNNSIGKDNLIIDQISIKSLRSDVKHEGSMYRLSSGILSHGDKTQIGRGIPVFSDLFIDLGSHQVVTHIGTIGSFVHHDQYPELPPRCSKYRYCGYKNRIHLAREGDDTSWPVSYRLFYKASVADTYLLIGTYKGNINEHGLVLNDISVDLGDMPVRYLMLKPVSNKHRKPIYKSHTQRARLCAPYPLLRMSVAIYGKCATAACNLENQFNETMIQYKVTSPPMNTTAGSILTSYQPKRDNYDYYTSNSKCNRFGLLGLTSEKLQQLAEEEALQDERPYPVDNEEEAEAGFEPNVILAGDCAEINVDFGNLIDFPDLSGSSPNPNPLIPRPLSYASAVNQELAIPTVAPQSHQRPAWLLSLNLPSDSDSDSETTDTSWCSVHLTSGSTSPTQAAIEFGDDDWELIE